MTTLLQYLLIYCGRVIFYEKTKKVVTQTYNFYIIINLVIYFAKILSKEALYEKETHVEKIVHVITHGNSGPHHEPFC